MSSPLPTFLLVGAAKSGTTALWHHLGEHPDISMSKQKEVFFLAGISEKSFPGRGRRYGRKAVTNLESYYRQFAHGQGQPVIGDSCVGYLYFHERTIARATKHLGPDLKIVIVLREPAARAYSNYNHHVSDGLEDLSFERALRAETWRSASAWWWGFRYFDVGLYSAQVRAYFEAFGRDRVFVLLHEELTADPGRQLRALYRFLGVSDKFVPSRLGERFNRKPVARCRAVNGAYRSLPSKSLLKLLPNRVSRRIRREYRDRLCGPPPRLTEHLSQSLRQRYSPDVQRLQELLGREFTAWNYPLS